MTALPLLTALLLTQAAPSDTLPLHRGQWVAQFTGGLHFASLGFIKFRSPKKALIVDIRIDGGHGEDVVTDSTGPHFFGLGSHANVDLRFGWRRYQSAGSKVAAYHSLGLLAGFIHSVSVNPGFVSDNGWNAGVFGDIGGSYFLTPQFSLGATFTAEIMYSEVYGHEHVAGSVTRRRNWDLNGVAPSLAVVAALYFR